VQIQKGPNTKNTKRKLIETLSCKILYGKVSTLQEELDSELVNPVMMYEH
jgi:hypothetical protein